MEIRVVTLLPPDFLWNPPSSSIEKVLLLMKLTDKPSQGKEETSKTTPNTNKTEDHKRPSAMEDGGGKDIFTPTSNPEMEIRVVTLLPPDFLWNPPSSSIEKVLLLMKLTDKPSQGKEETSKTTPNTNKTEDHKRPSAMEDEQGASSEKKKKKFSHNPLTIVSREQWGARIPRWDLSPRNSPFTKVWINHFYFPGPSCAALRCMQEFSMFESADIFNHFIVDGDGLVYEGRGWDAEWRTHIFDIVIIGNYFSNLPSHKEFTSCNLLVKEGLRLGKIARDYQFHSSTLETVYLEAMMHEENLHSSVQ